MNLSLRVQSLISLVLVACLLTATLAARGHGHGTEHIDAPQSALDSELSSSPELREASPCSCCRHTPPVSREGEGEPDSPDHPPLEEDCSLCAGFRVLSAATPVALALPELPCLQIAWRRFANSPALPRPLRFRGAASRAPPPFVIA